MAPRPRKPASRVTVAATYKDIRVLDLATNIAGPFAAMIFGDLGADVIKIERPPGGDDTRNLPPQYDGEAAVFLAVNRNKRSLLLDIKKTEGREALMRLAETADIVIESFPPGVADKLGLDYAAFKERNPKLILCSISAFGDGPIGKAMPGYDALVQAVSGLMSFTGSVDSPTVRIAPSVLDLGTGMWAAMGLMAALARRQHSGAGEHVRPALIDTAFTLMNHQLMGYLATGQIPEKLGSGAPSAAPYGVWQANDGELMIATASEPQFPRLCEVLDLQHLVSDDRFRKTASRLQNRQALDSAIAEKIVEKSVSEWLTILGDVGISAGRVNDVEEAMALPVAEERNLLIKLDENALPQLRLPIDPQGVGIKQPPPKLGQHSTQILREAGFSDGEICALL
jgi:crotonobetainyl-CoA:carnitine CoA-transferase CaiB-like acyl-CoA transferase